MKHLSILKRSALFLLLLTISVKGSFAQKNNANDKYLIILGAEHRYTQVTNSKSSSQEVIDNINSVIEKFNPDKIIYVYSVHKALSLSLKGPKTILDSVGMIRDERLAVVNENIITKESVDAFKDQNLIQFLKKNNAKDIAIVGFMADYYIQESLIGGKELGYNMFFIPKAIMGKSKKNKSKVFKKLKTKGIHQLSINEI